MKSIDNFILEKLKLNPQTKLKWSIRNAQDGDIITFENNNNKHIFIFANMEKNWRGVDHIYGHVDYPVGKAYINFCSGAGLLSLASLDKVAEDQFYLSTEAEKRLLFDKLKNGGYTWDNEKKELKKI